MFVPNTGHDGDGGRKIVVRETVTIVPEIARGPDEWADEERTESTTPASVPDIDIETYAVAADLKTTNACAGNSETNGAA